MAKIYTSVEQLIGNTPLLALNNLKTARQMQGNVFAKLEFFNPGGSVKDRVAKAMLDEAEKAGVLFPDSVIIEPTSGNTGIGLALVSAVRGYRAIIVMPDTMSIERQMLMKAYGAELVLTDGKLGMAGAIEKAKELAAEIPHSFIPDQFANPTNPKAHFDTTGPEIFHDLDGQVDVFVAGIGTGGTISGTAQYLREKNPDIRIIGVEPADSPVLTSGKAGAHALQGIGAGFIPATLDTTAYDEVLTVTTEDAYAAARALARTEGALVGISSGAALSAACAVAARPEYADKNIVVLLPDTGDRYLSTDLFR